MTNLPGNYRWLTHEPGPRMLLEALVLYGVIEMPGTADSPILMAWAHELNLDRVYTHDAIPWCGLFVAICAKRAGWELPPSPLWALSWAKWGEHSAVPMLGDMLTFQRQGGGHVALYIGEDTNSFHILGGNQGDRVCIERKAKSELYEARRARWKIAQPHNVRRVILHPAGSPYGLTEE